MMSGACALADYLNLSIADALRAEDPVRRGLALIDRRLGRRRFEELELHASDDPLVLRLHRLRAEAEGWGAMGAGAA